MSGTCSMCNTPLEKFLWCLAGELVQPALPSQEAETFQDSLVKVGDDPPEEPLEESLAALEPVAGTMQVCTRFMEREMDKNRVFTAIFLKQLAQSFQTTVQELASAFQTTVRQEGESAREMLSSLLQQQPQQTGREATCSATPTPAQGRSRSPQDRSGSTGCHQRGGHPEPPELTDGRLGGLPRFLSISRSMKRVQTCMAPATGSSAARDFCRGSSGGSSSTLAGSLERSLLRQGRLHQLADQAPQELLQWRVAYRASARHVLGVDPLALRAGVPTAVPDGRAVKVLLFSHEAHAWEVESGFHSIAYQRYPASLLCNARWRTTRSWSAALGKIGRSVGCPPAEETTSRSQ